MVTGWAFVAMSLIVQAPGEVPVETLPVVQPGAPVVAVPQPEAPVVAVPVAQPVPPLFRPAPGQLGPEDITALDRQFGVFYPGPKGKGLRIGGALAVAFGTLQMFSALICLGTAAGIHDAGAFDTARTLAYVGAGLGISGVLHTGAGVPMLIVGQRRQQRYHTWLLGQPGGVRLNLRPGAPGAGPLGLTLALRF